MNNNEPSNLNRQRSSIHVDASLYDEDLTNYTSHQRQEPTSQPAASSEIRVPHEEPTHIFDPRDPVDTCLARFISIEVERLDPSHFRHMLAAIPKTYILAESDFDLLINFLFHIKKATDKMIYNDGLALVKKLFLSGDRNAFLLKFWQHPNLTEGPMNYSFTNNTSKFEYTTIFNPKGQIYDEKADELAWSILLDLDATMRAVGQSYFATHNRCILFIILRRLKCLGQFMVPVGDEKVPVIMKYIREFKPITNQVFKMELYSQFISSLSWSRQTGKCHYSCIEPIDSLTELFCNYIKEDNPEFFKLWLKEMLQVIDPDTGFQTFIKWDYASKGYKNPAVMFLGLTKFFDYNSNAIYNDLILEVMKRLKKTLSNEALSIPSSVIIENERDYVLHYTAYGNLKIDGYKHPLPLCLFDLLADDEKTYFVGNEIDTRDPLKLLLQMVVVGGAEGLPLLKFEELWNAYDGFSDIMHILASSFVSAYNNYNPCISITLNVDILPFLTKLCKAAKTQNFCPQVKLFMGLDFDMIFECYDFLIAARIVTYLIQDLIYHNGYEPSINDLNEFCYRLLQTFVEQARCKIYQCEEILQSCPTKLIRNTAEKMIDMILEEAQKIRLEYTDLIDLIVLVDTLKTHGTTRQPGNRNNPQDRGNDTFYRQNNDDQYYNQY